MREDRLEVRRCKAKKAEVTTVTIVRRGRCPEVELEIVTRGFAARSGSTAPVKQSGPGI
jgi:hypothetical protein